MKNSIKNKNRTHGASGDSYLSIAPMVDHSNRHFRMLMRLIAPKALVYTEMQPVEAVLHERPQITQFSQAEHPIAMQVGGSDEQKLIQALQIAEKYGYDAFNLNLGCPSHRVLSGHFGACLMLEGERVAQWVRALKQVARIPITVKMRTGVDAHNQYDFLKNLAGQLIDAGVDQLIIHARSAWLKGLNPKQNRTIPPLQYDYVHQLKKDYPDCPLILNGQLNTVEEIKPHMDCLDGVMIGRLACDNPYALAAIHQFFYPESPILSREEVIAAYFAYAEKMYQAGVKKSILYKPFMNMMHGEPNAKAFKQKLLNRTY